VTLTFRPRRDEDTAVGAVWSLTPERPAEFDFSPPLADPVPKGRLEAEARLAAPEDDRASAKLYRLDSETGEIFEEAEIARLQAEGRLSSEDAARLAEVQRAFEDAKVHGEALKAAAKKLD
jgi:hypothetical protein